MTDTEEMRTATGLPVMTKSMASRLQSVINGLQLEGFRNLQMKGNPFQVSIETVGSASVCMVLGLTASSWWNQVIGMTGGEANMLDDILMRYRRHHFHAWIRTDTGGFSSELAAKMVQHGMEPLAPGTVLYGLPRAISSALPPDNEIHLASPDQLDLCGELWASGFQLENDRDRDAIISLRKGWFSVPGNYLYIARVEGKPAAVAGLYVKDGLGFLNVGTTLNDYRGKGIHYALCAHRISEAARMGCELVVGETGAFGSRSQNNMERAGLQIAYTHLTWVDRLSSP